jgi:hypothetical protein
MKHLIVCLGDQLEDGAPSEILISRLNEVLTMARAETDATILLAGARAKDDHSVVLTESEAMRRYLVEHEPNLETRLIMEDHSLGTLGELIKLRELIDTGAVQFEGDPKVTIVASECFADRVRHYLTAVFADKLNFELIEADVPAHLYENYANTEAERLVQAEIELRRIKPGDLKAVRKLADA